MPSWDVIVVGLGAVGSAALYTLAGRGARVLGLDRFTPPHAWGSSHGETRITREALGEGAQYVPFVRASMRRWAELEARSGETLFRRTGLLVLGPERPEPDAPLDFASASRRVAEAAGVPHGMLSAREVRDRFPAFAPRDDERAYWEPGAGLLYPERCVDVQLRLARADGAATRFGEAVREIRADGDAVRVVTDGGEERAARVIVSAGGWLADLVPAAAPLTRGHRQVLHWFAPARPDLFAPERCPVFIWHHGPRGAHFYGFPIADATGAVKLATEQFERATHPDAVARDVHPAEAEAFWAAHAEGRFQGLTRSAVASKVCLYTTTPDAGFLMDAPPGSPRVTVVSACSGHGFKHSAGVGEAAAALALGEARPAALEPFVWGARPMWPGGEPAAAGETPERSAH